MKVRQMKKRRLPDAKLPPLERPAPLPLSRDDSLGDQTPAGDDHHIPLTIQGSLERPPDVALDDRALPVMSQSSLRPESPPQLPSRAPVQVEAIGSLRTDTQHSVK